MPTLTFSGLVTIVIAGVIVLVPFAQDDSFVVSPASSARDAAAKSSSGTSASGQNAASSHGHRNG
jgi:hypothetical protein